MYDTRAGEMIDLQVTVSSSEFFVFLVNRSQIRGECHDNMQMLLLAVPAFSFLGNSSVPVS